MNEREYHRLREEVRAECQKKLEALELVWQMANGSSPPPDKKPAAASIPPRPQDQPRAAVAQSHGLVTSAVSAAVEAMGNRFSTKTVASWLEEHCERPPERSTVSHALKRLEEDGKLKMIELGRGKRPTLYEKIGTNNASSYSDVPGSISEELAQEIRDLAKAKVDDIEAFKIEYLNPYGALFVKELSEVMGMEVREKLLALP